MRNETIESVVKESLCTGCGTCVGLCPTDALHMKIWRGQGIYLPYRDEEKCKHCGMCFKVCSGHSVDFKQMNLEIFGRQSDDILLGNNINCYTGYSTDYYIRYNSASGGMVTALLVFALEEGIIDGTLVTKMREDKPLEPQPFIARTREEILSAAKSKYCPVPANIALKEIIKAKDGEKFAVVGLPCHIHSIRQAEQVNSKLKEKIALHLGIFCSYTDSFWGTEFILRKYRINKRDITRLDYRGEGWPGHMAVHLRNGSSRFIPFNAYMIFHEHGFFTPMRCTLCCDLAAEMADISFGDAWLPEIVTQDNIGTSLVISRSMSGESLVKQANAQGKITVSNIASDKIRTLVSKKDLYKSRSFVAHLLGKKLPTYRMELPKAKLSLLRSLILYLHIFIPKHRFIRGIINTMIFVERLTGKLFRLTGLWLRSF